MGKKTRQQREVAAPATGKGSAAETAEAVEAIGQLRDMFALALRAARGDEAAMRAVAIKNLGPNATEAEIEGIVAQLRASQQKR